MTPERIKRILVDVRRGKTRVADAMRDLRHLHFEDLAGFAKPDHHRALRRGLPEAIYGAGKTPEQIDRIAKAMAARGGPVVVTKTDERAYERVRGWAPRSRFFPLPGLLVVPNGSAPKRLGSTLVLAAGTSDLPVAEEAAETASALGLLVERAYDVGVAGLHRLARHERQLKTAGVLIVVAGMDGALPSVVAGLTRQPVVAVPTSVGYGASFQGLAALLAMLNSCSPGVALVNIDNGFGAAYLAASILGGRGKAR